MIEARRSLERGHADHGWLKTFHTFSFADYNDSKFMGFRSLRVINEDFVAPGQGFGTHAHHDMEILTYVLEGALEHKDSMGNKGQIRPGEVQRMSAGTGVRHSEFNPSPSEPVHLMQIWILPERRGIEPSYEQKAFPESERQGRLRLVASPDGAEGSVKINQDARLFAGLITSGEELRHAFAKGRSGYLQVARGEVSVNGTKLTAGDGAMITDEKQITVSGKDAEVLLFDLV